MFNLIGIVLALMILFFFLYKKLHHLLDSDMSSELVLSKLLFSKKAILTNSWFYSTEIRILNTQLVFSLLFNFFNSWFKVRYFSIFILIILLLVSFYYFCLKLKSKKDFYLFAIFLIIPFSLEYFSYVLMGTYYIPHIIIAFLSLGMIFSFRNSQNKFNSIFIVVLFSLLALLAGMGGARELIILYLPIMLACIIDILLDFWYNV